jgi:hypothetical protein
MNNSIMFNNIYKRRNNSHSQQRQLGVNLSEKQNLCLKMKKDSHPATLSLNYKKQSIG